MNLTNFIKDTNNQYWYNSPTKGFEENRVGPYPTLGDAVEDYCMHSELSFIAYQMNWSVRQKEQYKN